MSTLNICLIFHTFLLSILYTADKLRKYLETAYKNYSKQMSATHKIFFIFKGYDKIAKIVCVTDVRLGIINGISCDSKWTLTLEKFICMRIKRGQTSLRILTCGIVIPSLESIIVKQSANIVSVISLSFS